MLYGVLYIITIIKQFLLDLPDFEESFALMTSRHISMGNVL